VLTETYKCEMKAFSVKRDLQVSKEKDCVNMCPNVSGGTYVSTETCKCDL